MIEVKGLTKCYGEITAVSDVRFSVLRGKIAGFLGENGAGKTTTMDIMTGCLGADQGDVSIAGISVSCDAKQAKQKLGYLPDIAPLYPEMRVEDYIRYAAKLHRVPSSCEDKCVESAMNKLSLNDVRYRLIGNLSKGYRQRVALAQAIVHNPEVLILDEPTEGLDPNQIIQIRELIKALKEEHTIMLSSHILSEVEAICDEIIIIHQGKILIQGSCEEIVRSSEEGCCYEIDVVKDTEKLQGFLRDLKIVSSVKRVDSNSSRLLVSLKKEVSDQGIDEVVRKIVEGNFGLRRLREGSNSLEDVFCRLTK